MSFRRWDVVSVPFPFVERYASKRRPALVVSTDAFHRAQHACFAAMITTARNLTDVRADDITIADPAKAGLPQPCVIRLARLATFEWHEGIRRIGVLGVPQRSVVSALLKRWLGV